MRRIAKTEATLEDVRRAAVAMLARREHAAVELNYKLIDKGFAAPLAQQAVAELAAAGSQSDARFTEVFVRSKMRRGLGAARIRQELRARGVDDALIEQHLRAVQVQWREEIARVRSKRFGEELPKTAAERAKQMRFLFQRGFSSEQIRMAMRGELDE